MFTPEKIESYEYNEIIKMYNDLNISICSDIINKFKKVDKSYTKRQIKTIVETNGNKIFEKALLETAKLDSKTTDELKKIYEDVAKENMQGFKPLYDYRGKPFKISKSQYQILNAGIKKTGNELKNFTKTIAFNSQQLYVDAVDKAYLEVISGGIDYDTAIEKAYREVAESGIKLQDSAGRNVNLDVAVRRNVLTGIQQTTNEVNRDIEKQLGCDGYEVTAHIGARDTHAVAQGKQYAQSKKDAKKYGVGYWGDVSDLWEEANCRHTYFGIILGISEPVFGKKELTKLKNATVKLNGEKVPYNEAVSKQREIERNIRKQKRVIATLKESNKSYKKEQQRLTNLNKDYTKFTNETGIAKDYARIKI